VTAIGFVLAVLLVTPSLAAAWGAEGHEIVAAVAALRMTSAHAKQRVRQILGPGESLKEASTWADAVRHRTDPTQLPEALRLDSHSVRFVVESAEGKPNSDNARWHFVNLPLGASDYRAILSAYPNLPSPREPFASPRDIVHVITVCIERLRGHPVPGFDLTPKNALRMLVHLVGDLHQPLHVGSGYVAAAPASPTGLLERDPNTIAERKLASDRGGNSLYYKAHPAQQLHAHWDADLVATAMKSAAGGVHTVDTYAAYLAHLKPAVSWAPKGPITTWSVQWANDSLAAARAAYAGVTPTDTKEREYEIVVGHGPPKVVKGYPVALSPTYDTTNAAIVRDQLAKAGYRLARVLDAIWP
jgi:hypothetical protein